MYPLTCAGGYPVPIKAGRFSICGVAMTASDPTAASRCTFVDSGGFIIETDSQDLKPVLADIKGVANVDGLKSVFFPEPIRVRNGISIANLTNVVSGRTIVYVQ